MWHNIFLSKKQGVERLVKPALLHLKQALFYNCGAINKPWSIIYTAYLKKISSILMLVLFTKVNF